MLRVLLLGSACCLASLSAATAWGLTESENFNTPPADWAELSNRDVTKGTDFGYSLTNFSNGAASGEAGGVFPRTQTAAFYADVTIGELGYTSALQASGKAFFRNINADGRIDLGWFDKNDPPAKTDFIGLTINNGVSLQAAARPTGSGTLSNANTQFNLSNGLYNFSISYNGAGQLDVSFTDPANVNPAIVSSLAIPLGAYSLSAFGLTSSGEVGSNVPNLVANLYIDDITYTVAVPEPASTVLVAIGVFATFSTARRRRVG